MNKQPDALGYAVCLDARGFAAEADELRRLHAANAKMLEALKVALDASWDGPMPDYARDKACAAIAKAEEVKP